MDSLGGHRLDAKEIATPECFAVPFEEVGPRVRYAIRAGFNPMLLQNIPNGLPTDVGDAQLAKLADDAGQSKAGFLGDLEDQFSKLFWFSLATFGVLRLRLAVLLISHPVLECLRDDDRDQFLDGLAVLQQRLGLLIGRVDLVRNSGSENLVLVLEG